MTPLPSQHDHLRTSATFLWGILFVHLLYVTWVFIDLLICLPPFFSASFLPSLHLTNTARRGHLSSRRWCQEIKLLAGGKSGPGKPPKLGSVLPMPEGRVYCALGESRGKGRPLRMGFWSKKWQNIRYLWNSTEVLSPAQVCTGYWVTLASSLLRWLSPVCITRQEAHLGLQP